MKKWLFSTAILFSGLAITSCNKNISKVVDGHTSQNSLDWAGSYEGLINGVKVIADISDDESYTILVNDKSYEGTFMWNSTGQIIELKKVPTLTKRFFVGENRLFALDKKESKPDFSINGLDKVMTELNFVEDIPWRIIEVEGKDVEDFGEQHFESIFTLDSKSNDLNGRAGCNIMTATYQVDKLGQIAISPFASTKMMCPNIELENAVGRAFEKVNSYKVVQGQLLLTDKQGETMLKFVASGMDD